MNQLEPIEAIAQRLGTAVAALGLSPNYASQENFVGVTDNANPKVSQDLAGLSPQVWVEGEGV
jgi:hypothetical protein